MGLLVGIGIAAASGEIYHLATTPDLENDTLKPGESVSQQGRPALDDDLGVGDETEDDHNIIDGCEPACTLPEHCIDRGDLFISVLGDRGHGSQAHEALINSGMQGGDNRLHGHEGDTHWTLNGAIEHIRGLDDVPICHADNDPLPSGEWLTNDGEIIPPLPPGWEKVTWQNGHTVYQSTVNPGRYLERFPLSTDDP